MYKYFSFHLAAALALACAIPSVAAGSMQPGLWEVTQQSSSMKNMPKISPEQMRKMGVDISQLQSGAIVNRICITKQMAARENLP